MAHQFATENGEKTKLQFDKNTSATNSKLAIKFYSQITFTQEKTPN
jgi:hypothetical protein